MSFILQDGNVLKYCAKISEVLSQLFKKVGPANNSRFIVNSVSHARWYSRFTLSFIPILRNAALASEGFFTT